MQQLGYPVLHVYTPVLEINCCQFHRFSLVIRPDSKSYVKILEINAMCLDCLFSFLQL